MPLSKPTGVPRPRRQPRPRLSRRYPPTPEDAGVLTAAEAVGHPPPEEAVSIVSEPVSPPPFEDAEVLTTVEAAGRAPVEEATSTPPEPATTPSSELVPAGDPANNSIAAPVRLVAADSVVPAQAPGAAEPVEIVSSAEPATPSVDSQELAVVVSDIDEASTDSRLQEATSTPPAPATSPPLEEAGMLTAIETIGSPRLEEAAPSPPVPAEIVGPTEEVVMRATTGAMASTSAPQGPEPQETQRTPGADEEAGASPGSADDGGVSAGRAGYFARLQDWLSKRLRYPHVARTRRQTGTASIYVAVDRTGRVQDYELRTSSGHELLDREALAMIKRAQPLPALPEQMRQEHLELLVNIEFVLK